MTTDLEQSIGAAPSWTTVVSEADAERQRRQLLIAADYASGRLVAEIAKDNHCALSYPGYCAKKYGIQLRRAGAAWNRRCGF